MNDDNLIIRPCRDSDVPRADELVARAFQTLRHIYRPTPAALARKKNRTPAPRLLAVDSSPDSSEKILGSVEYELLPDQLSLMALAVHPDARRRGIARSLIRNLQIIAADNNLPRVTLWTITQTGNVPIFERLGFRTLRVTPADLFESDSFPQLTEALMELPIPTNPSPR